MKIYVVMGWSQEFPEGAYRWVCRAYQAESKAIEGRDALNTESKRIFSLPTWSDVVTATAMSADANMKHGDDAAEYYIIESELVMGE